MNNEVRFSYGSQNLYDSITDKDRWTVYFISDTKCIYFNGVKYSSGEDDIFKKDIVKDVEIDRLGNLVVTKTDGTVSTYPSVSLPIVNEINKDNPSDSKIPSEAAVVNFVNGTCKISVISLSDYNSLEIKDNNTLYFILDSNYITEMYLGEYSIMPPMSIPDSSDDTI